MSVREQIQISVSGDMLSVAAAQFGLKLLAQLVRQMPGKNVIVSPVGLFQALSLYALLGDEAARTEMRKALQIARQSDESLHSQYVRLSDRLSIQGRDMELSSATALWIGEQIKLDPSFVTLAERWGVGVFSGAKVTASEIQQWAAEQTRGLLSASIDPPGPTAAALMNAVYFHGTWATKFKAEDTKDRLFYRAGELPRITPLMRQSETRAVSLYHGPGFDVAHIPYSRDSGREISMHVFLPRRNALEAMSGRDAVTPLVEQFTLKDWDTCQAGYYDAVVDLILPRFMFRQTHDLRSVLLQMGMSRAFAAQATPALPAIQKVQQKAYIAVDEEGTTAAALTEIDILTGPPGLTPPPPRPRIEKFYVNRPFLFFLADDATGLLLFAGVIHDPEH